MKRTTLFLLAVTTASSCLFAQTTKNPFSELGYKKQITYTSSKGEFEEFHDNADVVEIGSVYFNTKTKKVVGYVNEEKENAKVATATSAMSVDPLCEKYYWISPYAYCMNNPVKFIDPDGKVVRIPKADRQEVLKAINSRAAGTFGINKKGELYLKKSEGASGYSEYYRDRLVAAIKDPDVVNISKSSSYTDKNGVKKDVDKDAGGGVTIQKIITTTDGNGKSTTTKEADIIYSGNENKNIKDTNGNALRDEPADIIMHEFVGHAAPFTVGTDTGNAVDNENKARQQLAPGQNQERKQDPNHKE